MPTLYTSPYRIIPLLTVLLLGLTACTPTTDTVSDNDVDNTSEVKVDERMATDISPSGSFTTNSLDNIKIGATFDPQILTQNTETLGNCFGAQIPSHPAADYMIIDNTVVEISTWSKDISSAYGVTTGDSLDQLYAKHDGQSPEVEYSPYGNPNENIIIYYWYEDNGQILGTKYQVDNGIVTSISIGLESALRLWEGCA
ncbi:hypothetical protein [Psychrobacter sp. DAB_AL32B]|uniref:hypothetical protein n=1 Tax=Psychrobacter sp. DAB_AL32B TaxID=1028414 RepID=UPI000F4E2BEA|nr:hypothetical protein [Psychrobacter sp. DAB_AL32B]